MKMVIQNCTLTFFLLSLFGCTSKQIKVDSSTETIHRVQQVNDEICSESALAVIRLPAQETNELTLFEKTLSFSVTTGYVRTTGLTGVLFGHFSQADENNVLKQIQSALAKDLNRLPFDTGSIKLLPPVVERSNLTTLDRRHSLEKSLFGVEKVHAYEKYRVDYEMRINVLLPKNIRRVDGYDYLGQITPTLRIEYFTRGAWQELARLDYLDPNMISLGAVDLSNPQEDVGKISLSDVHRKYRYELGQYLLKMLPDAKAVLLDENTHLRVSLDFQENGQRIGSSVLESTDRLEDKEKILKQVGVSGVKKYFDRFYYLQHLKQFRAKVFGGSKGNSCSKLFTK
jgi:hypothetical protein